MFPIRWLTMQAGSAVVVLAREPWVGRVTCTSRTAAQLSMSCFSNRQCTASTEMEWVLLLQGTSLGGSADHIWGAAASRHDALLQRHEHDSDAERCPHLVLVRLRQRGIRQRLPCRS